MLTELLTRNPYYDIAICGQESNGAKMSVE